MPAAANRRANGSRYISFTAPKPWAIATAGTRSPDRVCAGTKNQAAAKVSPLLNITSRFSIGIVRSPAFSFVPLCDENVDRSRDEGLFRQGIRDHGVARVRRQASMTASGNDDVLTSVPPRIGHRPRDAVPR